MLLARPQASTKHKQNITLCITDIYKNLRFSQIFYHDMPQKILSAVFWLTNVKFSIKRPVKDIYDSIVDVLKFMNLGVYLF